MQCGMVGAETDARYSRDTLCFPSPSSPIYLRYYLGSPDHTLSLR